MREQLTEIERIAMHGIEERDRAIVREHIQPLQDDFRRIVSLIEQRIGLEPGAIGTTHMLENGAVVPAPADKNAPSASRPSRKSNNSK